MSSFDFGDASDGDAHLDGVNTYSWALLTGGNTYTLLRPIYMHDLSIDLGITLIPAMFSIWGTGTLSNSGVIVESGGAGVAGDPTGPGGAGGTMPVMNAAGYLVINEWGNLTGLLGAGLPGGDGATTDGLVGNDSATTTSCFGLPLGGNGGASGNGSAGSGQIGGNYVAYPAGAFIHRIVLPDTNAVNPGISGQFHLAGGNAGGSGAGGAGDAVNSGAGGGGSGAGGGVVAIYFNTLDASGNIEADGGAGGPGGSPASGNAGGGGGGGGGSGGLIMMVNNTVINAGTCTVAGGTHGVGGTHSGTGTDGVNGTDGGDGLKIHYNISTASYL